METHGKIESFIKDLNLPKCITCFGEIIYYNTKVVNGKLHGKSALTTKTTGHTLKVCEKCLSVKFPEYIRKNKGRIFNQMNELTKFAFQIENDIYFKKRDSFIKNTVESFKEKFKENWETKWTQYCNKQAYSNSLEYKKEKHGMSEIEFKKFNKSRAVTEKNLVAKYGEVEGKQRFEEYRQKQVTTKSFDYMVEKFGYDMAKSINNSKSKSLYNFISKFGKEEGPAKYEKYWSKHKSSHSKIANEFFSKLDIFFSNYTTYYAGKNKEYGVNLLNRYVFIDYYILELNIGIEFNGDIFHANPFIYNKDEIIPIINKKASDVWESDNNKKLELLSKRGIQIITVWESDYNKKNKNNFDFLSLTNKILNESQL